MDSRGLAEISEVKLLWLSRGFNRKLSVVASLLRHNHVSHHRLIAFSKQYGWVGREAWCGWKPNLKSKHWELSHRMPQALQHQLLPARRRAVIWGGVASPNLIFSEMINNGGGVVME